MQIIFTNHAEERLRNKRQRNITRKDVIENAKSINGKLESSIRLRGFKTSNNHTFDLIMKDNEFGERIIITIIGKD